MKNPKTTVKKTDNKVITYQDIVDKCKRNPIRKKDYQERLCINQHIG